jgi:flavin-binding protein dodecin
MRNPSRRRKIVGSEYTDGRSAMSVAKVIEISATSAEGFDDAVRQGIAKAGESVRGIRGAWVKEQMVRVEDGGVIEYRVDMKVTFVLE